MTLGVIIIGALRFLPVPGLSLLIGILTAVIGLGAVLLATRRRSGQALPPTSPAYGGPGPGYY